MKRFLALLCCLTLVLSLALPAAAAGNVEGTVVSEHHEVLDDGIIMVEQIIEFPSLSRASGTRIASKVRKYYFRETLIADFSISATFSYNGTSANVESKSIDRQDTYNGWTYHHSAVWTSGGSTASVRLRGSLKKPSVSPTPVEVDYSLYCDADGNLS